MENTRQPATDHPRAFQDQVTADLTMFDAQIAATEARMADATAHELRDLALTLSRLAYSRRVLLKQPAALEPEQSQSQPSDLSDRRARGKALAEGLSAAS